MADQVVLPDWMLTLQAALPGEKSSQHIGRIVRALVGISLKNHADQLAQLFLVNEKPGRAASVSGIKTNCATSMREVWCLAGCKDSFVTQEYQSGLGVTWDLQAARDEGMLFGAHESVWNVVRAGVVDEQIFTSQADADKYVKDGGLTDAIVEKHDAWELIDEGWGLHYATPGTNNDHMEFSLAKPDLKTGMAEHAGGGREDNAITKSVGDIRWSLGRPLQHVIAPYKMAIAGGPLPLPAPVVPDPKPADPVPVIPDPKPAPILPAPATPSQKPVVHRSAGGAVAAWVAAAYTQHPVLFVLAIVATVGLIGLFVWEEIRLHQHKKASAPVQTK